MRVSRRPCSFGRPGRAGRAPAPEGQPTASAPRRALARLAWSAPLLAALPLALGACDRRLEPWVPLESEPARVERPVRIPGLGNPAPSQPMLRAAPLNAPVDGPSIRGVVRLAEGAEAKGSVLFVIARLSAAGPPMAVVRLPVGDFPVPFEIGPQDVMVAGQPLAGELMISARVDQDGNAMTRSAGDLVAELDAPIEPGATDVELVLDLPR